MPQKQVYVIETNVGSDLLFPPTLAVYEQLAEAKLALQRYKSIINHSSKIRCKEVSDTCLHAESRGWYGWRKLGFVRIVALSLR